VFFYSHCTCNYKTDVIIKLCYIGILGKYVRYGKYSAATSVTIVIENIYSSYNGSNMSKEI